MPALPPTAQTGGYNVQPVSVPVIPGPPKEGPRAVIVGVLIKAGTLAGELLTNVSAYSMSQVAAILINNSGNAFSVQFTQNPNGLTFPVAADMASMLPTFLVGTYFTANFVISVAQPNDIVIPVQLFNAPQNPFSWSATLAVNAEPVTVQSGFITLTNNPLNVDVTNAISISGTIPISAAGGNVASLLPSLAGGVVQTIKGSAGLVQAVNVAGVSTSGLLLALYDFALPGSVIPGTTIPKMVFPLGIASRFPGAIFSNGIQASVLLSTLAAAPGTDSIFGDVGYD